MSKGIRRILGLVALLLCAVLMSPVRERPMWAAEPVAAMSPSQISRIRRVLIISVDGLRPDVLLLADTPAIRSLIASGSYSFFARTIPFAYTLPSHTSMLTGVGPEKHGITWNNDRAGVYPNVPTIFELAHARGFTTALAASKQKFAALARPGSVDWQFIADEKRQDDTDVAAEAACIIDQHRPPVMFVHLRQVDVAGHTIGWGTPQQLEAAHQADECVGVVLTALKRNDLLNSTLIILTADHGGSGRGHGPNDIPSSLIPWIASGPGVLKNFDLTRFGGNAKPISTLDTFATACAALGIDLPPLTDGVAVMQIFRRDELLTELPRN